MIARLTGIVVGREDGPNASAGRCVIDVNGVGYLVQASSRTLAALPGPPGMVSVWTEMQVREDAITLFGFAEAEERDWFRLLTTVQGVGGRMALGILSTLAPRDLASAIAAGDRASLVRAPGVGPKLAVRLATELRDKVGGMPTGAGLALSSESAAAGGTAASDAVSALCNLGYRRAEAEAAMARVVERLGAEASLDALIRDGLKGLAR